jgi:hypothetical protein
MDEYVVASDHKFYKGVWNVFFCWEKSTQLRGIW